MIEIRSPWDEEEILCATVCWACHQEFRNDDKIAVVDAAQPKIVHAADKCRNRMTPL